MSYELKEKMNVEWSLDFNSSLMLKNHSLPRLLKVRPELENLIPTLDAFLPAKEFLTLDYFEQVLRKGLPTCVNPAWHVDGVNNHYLMLILGEWRTEFALNSYPIPEGKDLREVNFKISQSLKKEDVPRFELPELTPILYNSFQVHRGRVPTTDGKRILLRLCRSDYLRPSNSILKLGPL